MRISALFGVLAALALVAGVGPAAAADASPIGRWLTEGDKAVIEVAPCGASLCGRIVRILKRDPGAAQTDLKNPDPGLRAGPILGLTILTGFRVNGARWQGRVYDPQSGKVYKSYIEMRASNTLILTGCVWVLCQGQTWRRTN